MTGGRCRAPVWYRRTLPVGSGRPPTWMPTFTPPVGC